MKWIIEMLENKVKSIDNSKKDYEISIKLTQANVDETKQKLNNLINDRNDVLNAIEILKQNQTKEVIPMQILLDQPHCKHPSTSICCYLGLNLQYNYCKDCGEKL